MKGLKKVLAVVLCMLLMLTPLATVAETVTVHAAQDVKTVKVKTDKKQVRDMVMMKIIRRLL